MRTHFGVYGLILRNREVLLVRKTRGPYAGLLDLPGGTPEPADGDHTATLAREIAEETGLALVQTGAWHKVEILVTRDSHGQAVELRHSGVWTVATAVALSTDAGRVSPDTSGCAWADIADWRSRHDLSPLVQAVLSQAEANGCLGG